MNTEERMAFCQEQEFLMRRKEQVDKTLNQKNFAYNIDDEAEFPVTMVPRDYMEAKLMRITNLKRVQS